MQEPTPKRAKAPGAAVGTPAGVSGQVGGMAAREEVVAAAERMGSSTFHDVASARLQVAPAKSSSTPASGKKSGQQVRAIVQQWSVELQLNAWTCFMASGVDGYHTCGHVSVHAGFAGGAGAAEGA